MRKSYFVYILTNHTNSVLYTGVTNNLSRRAFEHKQSLNADSFTNKYRLYKLVWFKEFSNPNDAIRTEKQIKGWIRLRKLSLIGDMNPDWKNLLN